MHHKSLLAFLFKKTTLILFFSFLFKNVVLLLNSKLFIFSGTCHSEANITLSMKKKFLPSSNP